MIRETYRAESIARERAIAHFINGVSGQSLVNAETVQVPITDSISPVRHAIDLDLRRVCGFD